jgi:hypothetical protein
MATINGKNYSSPKNINLKEGFIRFGGTSSTNPFDSDSNGIYINSSNQIVYSAQGSESILGTAGSTVNFSLNDAYDDGRSITVDAGAVTLNGVNMDTATLALNADAASSGPIVLFTNAGSGNDVTGTSATWGVSKAGVATFASVIAESVTAAANLDLEATGAGTIKIATTSTGAVTIGTTLTVTGSADANAFTITAGDVLISDGKIVLTDNDNETILSLTSSGVSTRDAAVITCNGLTDGSILKLVTTDAGLTTGNFIECDEDGSIVFEVGDDGAVTIAGSAAGVTALSITAGDLIMSSGVASITNTTNATTLAITVNATAASDVLITASGAKADNKASLEVTNSGATAAGGSILRVTNTGTPAAATSYLVDFDYSGATMTNNPTTVYINGKDSTNSTVLITGSGAIAAGNGTLEVNSTAAGAAGAVLTLSHDSASPANSDVIGAIHFYGLDNAAADQQYAKIECQITDVTAASNDADLIFSVAAGNTVTQMLKLDSDVVGILVGSGSAAATVTSAGAYDLTISTNSTAANEPKIVLTDGAAGDITITAGGTSGKISFVSPLKYGGVQAIVNANTAIDVVTPLTTIANNAGSTHTLADGVVGQIKTIVCTVYTGNAVITPANFVGTTITLNAAGDS